MLVSTPSLVETSVIMILPENIFLKKYCSINLLFYDIALNNYLINLFNSVKEFHNGSLRDPGSAS